MPELGHIHREAQTAAAELSLPPGQAYLGTHTANAGGDLATTNTKATPRRASSSQPSSGGHELHDAQLRVAPGTFDGHTTADAHVASAVDLPSALLMVYADAVDDLEKARIAAENRHRSLIQVKGLAGSPEAERLAGLASALKALEHGATLDLKRALRRHPLGAWVKRTVGVGEKQGARLIATIGDPLRYVDGSTGEVIERTVSRLWAYCGYRPDQKRTKGQRSNWNATAKMRARLVAESCLKAKARSPYGPVYDAARGKYAARDDWSDLRRHNAALRCVAKEVLKDLWREAREQETAA